MTEDYELVEMVESAISLTEAKICIYDIKKFFSYNKKITRKDFMGHYCEFCKKIRSTEKGFANCVKSDVHEAVELAKLYKEPFFHLCHIGLLEYIIPIHRNDVLVAVCFIGQCRIKNETSYKSIAQNIKENIDSDNCYQEYMKMPEIERHKLVKIGYLLNSTFKRFVYDDNLFEQYIDINGRYNSIEKAKIYIQTMCSTKITPYQVAEKVHLNQSYLSRIFKNDVGLTIGEYIIKTKIDKAKEMLIKTNIPINSISFNVGFEDPNYFSRVFKKTTGFKPSEYKSMHKN